MIRSNTHQAHLSNAASSAFPAPTLTPRLIVADAVGAIAFYVAAFGAIERECFKDPNGRVVHAALSVGQSLFSLAEEAPEWRNFGPKSLNGSPVLFTLSVDDADAVAESAVQHGAEIIIPIADQFYGKREGRVIDPFGHLWIISTPRENLSDAEIRQRLAAWSR